MGNRLMAMRTYDIFDAMISACDAIKEAGACESCPLRANCIEEVTAESMFCDTAKSMIDEFYGFADDVREYGERRQ